MSDNRGVLIIGEDAVLKGDIRNCREIEVFGYVEGTLEAGSVIVHQGGRLYGKIKADTADVLGTLQGDVRVRELISIRASGSVAGNVKYGRLAMEEGADLTASVRNVPPQIAGDLDIAVTKGRSVRITPADVSAVDPDDKSTNLTFTVSNAANGFVTFSSAPGLPISNFTQSDLETGKVLFAHDGTDTPTAKFDIIVADAAGATSGRPQTVNVAVRG
ncbi:MAG: polymer-forming cytoskeletal protein [Hyphomicrobium sp.]